MDVSHGIFMGFSWLFEWFLLRDVGGFQYVSGGCHGYISIFYILYIYIYIYTYVCLYVCDMYLE